MEQLQFFVIGTKGAREQVMRFSKEADAHAAAENWILEGVDEVVVAERIRVLTPAARATAHKRN